MSTLHASPSPRPRSRRVGTVTRTATRYLLGPALLALGLTVVPSLAVTTVTDYRAEREPLRFVPAAQVDPIPTTTSTTAATTTTPLPAPGPATGGGTTEIATSGDEPVAPFVTIGVSLAEAPDTPVQVRWRDADGWSEWNELEIEADKGPDPGTAEAATAAAKGVVSEPLWVGRADAYQVALDDSVATDDAEVVLVRPSGTRVDVHAESVPAGADSVGQPPIHTRAEWGARAPSNPISSASQLRFAVVHHSATGNDYSQAEVPSVIRSIQAYHIDSRGWSDIGYNFVVDRFGGIWEGRDGSLGRASIGAHAEGFNTSSVGVVALGEYTTASASNPQIDAITEVISWKFASAAIDPNSRIDVTSGGSSTIPAGQVVNLPRVVGHRDVGSTECPGNTLYGALNPRIRPMVSEKTAAKSSPIGRIDIVSGGPRSILLSGWALDPLVTSSIDIHVYVDGVGRNLGPTPVERPDLAGPYPSSGTRHGFSTVLGDVEPGLHTVCVYGINTGPGSNSLLGCPQVVVPSGAPIGRVDIAAGGPDGAVMVTGWAVDPDTTAPVPVHVYVDDRGVDLGAAANPRPDLVAHLPLYGAAHGFAYGTGGVAPGRHRVCAYAINVGPGGNSLLDCRIVDVPGGAPTGVVDTAFAGPDGVIGVSGWALDPDTAASIPVHVYVDADGTNLGPTPIDRPDIAAAFPGYGARHGYGTTALRAAPGLHNVCVYAIGSSAPNSFLGCRGVAVPGGSPIGWLDAVVGSGGRIGVSGWTLDPDTAASIDAHVYIDGVGYNTGRADRDRPDVAAGAPGYGAAHGVSWLSPPMAPGNHQVCFFGINAGVGRNALIDCRNVSV